MNQNTLEFCTNMLSAVKNVAEWNMQMKQLVTVGMTSAMRGYIESSGLIVKVLGIDRGQPIITN